MRFSFVCVRPVFASFTASLCVFNRNCIFMCDSFSLTSVGKDSTFPLSLFQDSPAAAIRVYMMKSRDLTRECLSLQKDSTHQQIHAWTQTGHMQNSKELGWKSCEGKDG